MTTSTPPVVAPGPDRARLLAELCGLVARNAHRTSLPLAGLALVWVDAIAQPTSSIADASLAFVVQGAKRIAVGEHVLEYGPGDYLIVSVDLPVTGQFTAASVDEPFLGIGLELDPSAIASLLLDVPAARAVRRELEAIRAQPAVATSSATPQLLDALVRLLRLLDAPHDAAVLAPMIQREILWRLLCSDQGQLVAQIGSDGNLARIGQAVQWIRANYPEPFRVEQLAGQVAMSASGFHRHFRAATSMGPIQFQKKVRLQQARLQLLASTSDITRIAHSVGYESQSQFSREYRREFGTSPSHDARRLTG